MRSILPKGENRKRRSIAARAIACVLVALLALPFAGCSASPNATGATTGSQEYTVSVSLSGGSGRASISSPTTIMKDGDTYTATITWSSSNYDKMTADGTFNNFSKREKLQIERQRAKLEKNLGSIADLTRLPAALFVVDVMKESNAVKEAKRLNIPVFAIVDTCCDPTDIDYVIPANDDASNSIAVILTAICAAVAEGTEERRLEKEKEAQEGIVSEEEGAPKKEGKPRIKKAVKATIDAEEAAVAEVVAATEQAATAAAEVVEAAAEKVEAAAEAQAE